MNARKSNECKYECLLFDMDDTLYPMSSGINLACRMNIEEYMLRYLKMEESQVPRMCLELYKEYGTTMAGLKALGYEFDNDQFHAYVHGRLPYDNLKPDPTLKNLLLSMPQRRIIFTNADKAHSTQVLKRLGLEDCFQGIICFETLNSSLERNEIYKNMNKKLPLSENYADDPDRGTEFAHCNQSGCHSRILCKPSLKAIEAAIQIANADPMKTIFFDDSARNIASAKIAGLRTVVVGSTVLVPGADLALGSIHNMKEALPEIWEGEDQETQGQVLRSKAVETTVLA
ncbi:hypothetical protein Scep_003850 [Stephania cephalantha]|uniref:Pyrimidine 5-nucleotidase n=1 Tax=Stephania cephalantha TaxID=152367 RepID=A0AAP0KRE0_9MAGN